MQISPAWNHIWILNKVLREQSPYYSLRMG